MIRAGLRRLGWSLLVVWAAVTLTFAAGFLIPSDPARAVVGPHADASTVEHVRAQLCLDRGFLVAYGCHVGALARGDLGTSFRTGQPVAAILAERIGPTAELALTALLLQVALGFPLGVLAARAGPGGRGLAEVLTAIAASVPTFFLGPLLMYLVGYQLELLPVWGHGEVGVDRLRHLALPAITLAAAGIAGYARLVSVELQEVMAADYIRTARAKGLSPRAVLLRHGLRNALLPVVTLMGVDLGVLLGGAVVTETVFGWPGLGREAVLAILNVDLPVVLGVVLVGAVAVVLASLVVDAVVAALDPRIRG
jgi:ABC-type dipeptide/oligopeptide/nickel transport system permease component